MASLLLLGPGSHFVYAASHAAGEDIRIVSESQEINFPSNVDFEITVESTTEITEIRLLFRSMGSRVWAYAYPSFEPGKRVTANHQLATTGNSYVPPGAELEYHYVIRDAAGNTLETEPATFEYTDTRFQWDRTQIGPLTLVHHDIRQSSVDKIADRITPDMQRLSDLLEIQDGKKIKGIIYNRRWETEDAFPFQSQTLSDAGVFQGFAFSNHRIFIGVGLDPRLIVHETAHLLLDQSLGARALAPPAWLNEGFASYMEPNSYQHAASRIRDQGLPLRSMTRVSGTPSHIGAFYQKSSSVVAFLVQYRGEAAFQKFLAQLRQAKTVDQALMAVYGFDIDGLESRWAGDIGGSPEAGSSTQQRQGIIDGIQNDRSGANAPTRPSPFLYFDAWVFGGLGLLVLAMAAARLVMGTFRPKTASDDESEDWLNGDDWPPSTDPR
ncbi:MAG: hypothetical protein IIC99_11940 [Chloroflexi bacterium]|nr:hypothetical protein [Chloroflexota bacterium]